MHTAVIIAKFREPFGQSIICWAVLAEDYLQTKVYCIPENKQVSGEVGYGFSKEIAHTHT